MKRIAVFFLVVFIGINFPIMAQQMAPSVTWSKVYGGSRDDKVYSIINTVDHGVLLIGTSYSNDGNVSGHHGPTTTSDAWVVKLSASGNIEWQRSLGGANNDDFKAIIRTTDGNYVCVGSSSSNDGDVSGNHGGTDVWAVKIDRYGNILWQKSYGGTGGDVGMSICNTSDGNALIQANSNTNNNGDVSNFHNDGSSPKNDIWILKINPANGAIIWQRCFGGSHIDNASDIEDGGDGSFIIVGDILSDDGDFGANGGNTPRGKVVKILPDNTVRWKIGYSRWLPVALAKTIPYHFIFNSQSLICYPQTGNWGSGIEVVNGKTSSGGYNSSGGPGFGGTCTMSATLEGTTSVATINQIDNIGVASSSYALPNGSYSETDGNIVGFKSSTTAATWRKTMGGSLADKLTSAVAINDNEYVVAGYTNSNDGDISGNHGGYDFWVIRLGKTNTIKGSVFLDYNINGVKDANEPFTSNITVESRKGNTSAASLSYNGNFSNVVDTGNYQTKIISSPAYYTSVPVSLESTFASYNATDNVGFALQPIPGKRDYRVFITSPDAHRPGFEVYYRIRLVNAGTDTLVNRLVKMVKDARLQLMSSTPAHVSASGDTVSWNISYLPPRDTTTIYVKLKIAAPPAVNIGTTLLSKVMVDTTGDLLKQDNEHVFHGAVSGAFDPNDKFESSGNTFNTSDLAKGRYLHYTIRFQNTGNDTAFNISVRDTLDTKLDWNSFEMIASSHPYFLKITDGNKLEWNFNNILLVDSIRNEPGSHGFITYRVRPQNNLVAGDAISNSASIYFDFNLPVKTNTQVNLIKAGIPRPSPQVSGLAAQYCASQAVQKAKIANLPPPDDGIGVTVKLNATSLSVAGDSTFSFDPGAFGPGMHMLQVAFADDSGGDTLMIAIRIDAAASPEVNVTANMSIAQNLVDPVVITAVSASGGGTAPLYTFAKDRNFNSILQAESSNHVLNILPTALQAGDNWIYVRMKTSSSCYTASTNADSVKIVLQLPVPGQPVITGLGASYCKNEGVKKAKIVNMPSAATGVTMTVKLDGVNLVVAADTSFTLDLNALSTGNHSVVVTYSNISGTASTTANFTVAAAQTPGFTLTSNTSGVSGNDAVIVTASNAVNGGSTPVYTFAKDRNFTDILQAEGAGNTASISGSALNLGDNRIYVRMRTSLSCYTAQTAIDSIGITRTAARGLLDPDFPGRAISVNPNPAISWLNLRGISSSKTYTLVLQSQQGRVIKQWQINGRTTFAAYMGGQSTGIYLLSIYDDTKKRLIGTIEVVKH